LTPGWAAFLQTCTHIHKTMSQRVQLDAKQTVGGRRWSCSWSAQACGRKLSDLFICWLGFNLRLSAEIEEGQGARWRCSSR